MKKARIHKFSKASLAIAISIALGNHAYAKDQENLGQDKLNQDQNAFNVLANPDLDKTDDTLSIQTKRVYKENNGSKQVRDFSTKTVSIMTLPSSIKYLNNQAYADVSTFPMRLINALNDNPWQASPNLPIPDKDIACYFGVPSYRTPLEYDPNTTPITITADSVLGSLDDKKAQELTYVGNVSIEQGDKQITSDKAVYYGKEKVIVTKGQSSQLSSSEYTVTTSDEVVTNLEDKTLQLGQSTFVLNGSILNGTAKSHSLDNKTGTKIFKQATISTCPTEKKAWHLWSSSVEMKKGDSFGSAWNDVLFIGDVPVFYSPYVNFPITKKRQSGLLIPTVSYSNGDGISLSQPIYLNLATNYDAQVTPTYDAEHDYIYDFEFRYLPIKNINGKLNFTYLPDDPMWENNSSDKKRWHVNVQQDATFLESDLVFRVDFSKVRNNDYTYLTDISQNAAAITDSSLLQKAMVTYDQSSYTTSLEFRKYQNMYTTTNFTYFRPFALLPQFKFDYAGTQDNLIYSFSSEVTRFNLDKMQENKQVNVHRAHLQPSVKYHAYDSYGSLAEFGLTGFFTHYTQDDLQYMTRDYRTLMGYDHYDNSVNRALFLFESRAKTTLERKILDLNHTQTLEPEIKYQYVPYKDQTNIALYDTSERYDDYYSLFSSYRYAGIDRIADLNTITFGITSRILDAHDRETLRMAIAQSYDFQEQKVTLYANDPNQNRRSPFEAVIDAQPIDGFSIHAGAKYNHYDNKIYNFDTSVRYNDPSGFMFGVSYRFFREGNFLIQDSTRVDLSQVGVEMKMPMSNNWNFIAASYREIEQSYNIDSKVGFIYDDCCYSLGILYENYMKMDWQNMKHKDKKIIGLRFELKGLYAMDIRGITDPLGTSTHYIPSVELNNLNR